MTIERKEKGLRLRRVPDDHMDADWEDPGPVSGLRRPLAWLGHRYPLYSGCATLANSRLIRSLRPATGELVRTRLRDGSTIIVASDEWVGWSIVLFGDLDRKITWFTDRILRPGDLVIDVGANWGVVTLACARRTGPTGRVLAFEPQPRLASAIRRSAVENRYHHVDVRAVALGDRDGLLPLHVPLGNSGAASLVREYETASSLDVPVVRSGPFLERLIDRPIRLVKLDIEGGEEDFLRGAAALFSVHPPDVVLFESNRQPSTPFWMRQVPQLLSQWGYRLFTIPRRLRRPRLCPVDEGQTREPDGHDFIAVQSGRPLRELGPRLGL